MPTITSRFPAPRVAPTAKEGDLVIADEMEWSRRGRLLLPGWVWAAGTAAVSIGWLTVQLALGTNFFAPDNGLPGKEAVIVWATIAAFAVQSCALIWVVGHPILVFWSVYAVHLGAVYLIVDRGLSTSVTYLFSLFAITALTRPRRWVPMVAAAAAVDLGLYLFLAYQEVEGSLDPITALRIIPSVAPDYLAPVLAGVLYAVLRTRAELESEKAQVRADAVLAAERYQMARELHDDTAHHLTGIRLHGQAIEHLRKTDPTAVDGALQSIVAESEAAMRSLHDVIAVLRAGRTDQLTAPTLDSLPELIESSRAQHSNTLLDVQGDLSRLSPAVSLAGYRIIQESLANAGKHAPDAPVAISVSCGESEMRVSVVNAPPKDRSERAVSGGFGLLGMHERAAILGGTLRAGPTAEGGWQTEVILPLGTQPLGTQGVPA